jgi:hypothetical protein
MKTQETQLPRISWLGIFYLIGGLLSATGGCAGILLRGTQPVANPHTQQGSWQFARQLVLPQAVWLLGMGIALYGLILIVSTAIKHSRSRHRDAGRPI